MQERLILTKQIYNQSSQGNGDTVRKFNVIDLLAGSLSFKKNYSTAVSWQGMISILFLC